MPFYEREEKLLDILSTEKLTTVDEICEKLYISKPTVRRDLDKLAKKGLIKRTHGGAYLTRPHNVRNPKFQMKEHSDSDANSVIAKKAAEHIQDGFVIMLDSSDSAFAIIPHLSDFKDLTIISNSAKVSFVLGQLGISNISTGGKMNTETLSYTGELTVNSVNKYNADICFISSMGITSDGYLTNNSEEENSVKYAMISKSRKKILLCESNKFDKTYFNNLCHISEFDEVISEYRLPERFAEMI